MLCEKLTLQVAPCNTAFNLCIPLLRKGGIFQKKAEKEVDFSRGKVRNTGIFKELNILEFFRGKIHKLPGILESLSHLKWNSCEATGMET